MKQFEEVTPLTEEMINKIALSTSSSDRHVSGYAFSLTEYFEGKLLLHRWFSCFGPHDFTFHQDYYTVKNGKVFHIRRNGQFEATGDEIANMCVCENLGDLNEDMLPEPITPFNFSYKEFKKFIKKIKPLHLRNGDKKEKKH